MSVWLPNAAVAAAWTEYSRDTKVSDTTPPPAPTNVRVDGKIVTWTAEADLESGLAGFLIERDGQPLTPFPKEPKNPFGRPIFQNLSYSDTPTQPLVEMRFEDTTAETGENARVPRDRRQHGGPEVRVSPDGVTPPIAKGVPSCRNRKRARVVVSVPSRYG